MIVIVEIESNNLNSLDKARAIIKLLEQDLEISNSKFEKDFNSWIDQFLNPKHSEPRYNRIVEWKDAIDSFKDRFPLEHYTPDQLQDKIELWSITQNYKIGATSRDKFIIQQ